MEKKKQLENRHVPIMMREKGIILALYDRNCLFVNFVQLQWAHDIA